MTLQTKSGFFFYIREHSIFLSIKIMTRSGHYPERMASIILITVRFTPSFSALVCFSQTTVSINRYAGLISTPIQGQRIV